MSTVTTTNTASKRSLWERIFGPPKPSTAEEMEHDRKVHQRNEAMDRARELRKSKPAEVVLGEQLAQAGLPPDVHYVVGRSCSYWQFGDGWSGDYPYVSQIVGIRSDSQERLELALSFGPGGVPRIIYWDDGWFYEERGTSATKYERPKIKLHKFQLL